jgi:hypothetical protein
VALPLSQAAAVARVQAAYVAEGLPIASSEGGIVTATDTDRILQIRYSVAVLPVDSAHSRAVLTASGTRPRVGIMPEATARPGDLAHWRAGEEGVAAAGAAPRRARGRLDEWVVAPWVGVRALTTLATLVGGGNAMHPEPEFGMRYERALPLAHREAPCCGPSSGGPKARRRSVSR